MASHLKFFLGWYLCVYTFYQIFAIYLYRKKVRKEPAYFFPKMYWIQPTVLYLTGFLFYLFKIFFTGIDMIISPDGKTWWSQDIYQAALLMTINTMMFVAVIAAVKISAKTRNPCKYR